jgi:hypothetical protein
VHRSPTFHWGAELLKNVVLLVLPIGCHATEPAPPEQPVAPTSVRVAGDRGDTTTIRDKQHAQVVRQTTPLDCGIYDTSPSYRDSPAWVIENARTTCELWEELRSFLVVRQQCQRSADCTTVASSCPFGCGIPVASSFVAEVTAKLRDLQGQYDATGRSCQYKCKPTRSSTCFEGRCVDADPF